jgi:hypothetical protein
MLTNPNYKDKAYDNIVKHIATLKMLVENMCTYTYCGECPLNIKDSEGCMFTKFQNFIDAIPDLRTKLNVIEKEPKHSRPTPEAKND